MLGSDCKPFSVFFSAADVEDEGDKVRILCHHFFQESDREVDAFDDKGLVALLELVDDFCQLFLYKCCLLLVSC